jgi:hypothetical protein
MDDSAPCKLALATTWSGDLWGLRKELIPWLTYHAYLGVSKLYVLYEGSDPRTLRVSGAVADTSTCPAVPCSIANLHLTRLYHVLPACKSSTSHQKAPQAAPTGPP